METDPVKNPESDRNVPNLGPPLFGGLVMIDSHDIQTRPLNDLLAEAGLIPESACGGAGTCGKCRVMVEEGTCLPPSVDEASFLSPEDLGRGIRLACYCQVRGPVSLRLPVPAEQERILTSYAAPEFPFKPFEPDKVQPPDAGSGALHFGAPGKIPPSGAGSDAPDYGVAVDIGTTTVVAVLNHLATGQEVAVASALNPQTRFGFDVLTRIQCAHQSPAGLERLQAASAGCLNSLITRMCRNSGVHSRYISRVSVAANTVMLHLLLGIDPAPIGRAPYEPVFRQAQTVPAADIGIRAAGSAQVYCLPSVSGFVGADIVGGIMATGLDKSEDTVLFLDLGTNGEMVLFKAGRPVACSTAAGPALEGMNISCGMRAADGAVEAVSIGADGRLAWRAIGSRPPRGLCGSGLLDLVAALLDAGLVAPSGRLADRKRFEAAHPGSPLAGHLEEQGGRRRFRLILAPEPASPPPPAPHTEPPGEQSEPSAIDAHDALSGNTGCGCRSDWSDRPGSSNNPGASGTSSGEAAIFLTQADIRQVQVAKSAIAAGIKLLLETAGIAARDVERVVLAGAFGAYLNPHTLVRLGFCPASWEGRMEFAGNTSLAGARMALLSASARMHMEEFAPRIEYLRLEDRPAFEKLFVDSMELGVMEL